MMNLTKLTKKELIYSITSVLEREQDILFAYLFGSSSRDNAGVLSDVDIAIYVSDVDNLFDYGLGVHHALSKKISGNIDLVVLNTAKNLILIYNITRKGELIFCRDDEARINYELLRFHEYLDFKENPLFQYAGSNT